MNRSILLLTATLILSTAAIAQQANTRKNSTNNNAWFIYFGNHKFSEKFGLHAEMQVRRNEGIQKWQQLLLRTGFDYYTANVRFTVGYAFVETYPYGEFPVTKAFPEHRLWQQTLVDNTLGKLKLTHRFRLEQRWIGNSATGEFKNGRYENRMRYMARVNVPLKGATIQSGSFYLGFYNEIFINFGKEVAYNLFDQNRAYAALGYHLGKVGKVELGYLYQLVQQRSLLLSTTPVRSKMEQNHTIQLALINDLPFYKK